jgi:hypothetical protein
MFKNIDKENNIKIKKILILSIFIFITSCSQYQDKKMLCRGTINLWTITGLNVINSQSIGLRIENDSISLSGNNFQSIEEQKVCKIGTIEFSKKDEIYFDSDGCSMNVKNIKDRKFGTYNYITKQLSFSQNFDVGTFNEGSYICVDEM